MGYFGAIIGIANIFAIFLSWWLSFEFKLLLRKIIQQVYRLVSDLIKINI